MFSYAQNLIKKSSQLRSIIAICLLQTRTFLPITINTEISHFTMLARLYACTTPATLTADFLEENGCFQTQHIY